ncbi:kalirin-like isoform X1 [Teleopsis dalmanni]|uniref:kalirin-like isoform X1 n=1 Tax=Teleopsis dalmanni TaxID=139649 RepID=UPI0018CCAE44|nr:kalirin-like isoform X1 [Teleopsis dalmanni]
MLFGLVYLTWFDTLTVTLSILAIVIIQIINSILATDKDTTTQATTAINGILRKQNSEYSEDLPSNNVNTSPPVSARNSISSPLNGSIPQTPSSETLSDEYHEDEDTLSLENLFPCDQTEIYASKKISFIIDELIQTEVNYLNNLRKGLQNYGKLHERQDLPEALKGSAQNQNLLGNIGEIMSLHEEQILPMMLRNQRDLKSLFDEFAVYFDKNHFYCYVIYMINKKTSMELCKEQREWFQGLQTEINDKLGIDSFLVQPIQRLTRYPLLLQQFISEFYKSGISCKPVLVSVCKLETRMRRLLEVVNQAEEISYIEDINELNLLEQGNFRKSTELDAYNHRSRKKHRAKVFLFDRCLVCAEIRKKRLTYRQHYAWPSVDLQLNNSKSVTLLLKANTKEEYEFSSPEATSITAWMRFVLRVMETSRILAEREGKFSLPMDLVLFVALAVWLIWHYLY